MDKLRQRINIRVVEWPTDLQPTDSPAHGMNAILDELSSLTSKLTLEVRLFDRLLYKGKNQHRSTVFYRRLKEVARYSKRYAQIDVQKLIKCVRNDVSEFILERILASVCLSEQIIDACMAAAACIKVSLLAPGYFLPWGLTCYASVSRIAYIQQNLMVICDTAYSKLRPSESSLPEHLTDILTIEIVKTRVQAASQERQPPPIIDPPSPGLEIAPDEDFGEAVDRDELSAIVDTILPPALKEAVSRVKLTPSKRPGDAMSLLLAGRKEKKRKKKHKK